MNFKNVLTSMLGHILSVPFCSHISKCRFSYDVAHIYICMHMYVLCMMLYIILNNTIYRGRTKIEIKKKVRKTKVQVF